MNWFYLAICMYEIVCLTRLLLIQLLLTLFIFSLAQYTQSCVHM